jgi:hypothetical protein
MSPIAISFMTFAFVFAGALFGIFLQRVLPLNHVDSNSKDVVKLGVGLVGTMAALVLGLLIASAKSSFERKALSLRKCPASSFCWTAFWRTTDQRHTNRVT